MLCFQIPSYAQDIVFQKITGSADIETAVSVKQSSDGDIYVAGYTHNGPSGGYDQALLKFDEKGNLRWVKYYGGSRNDHCLYLGITDRGRPVLCGITETPAGETDVLVTAVDTSGSVIWQNTYGSAVNESAKYIEQTADKGFILCGFQNDSNGSNDIYVLKLDSNGGKQWDQTYGGADNDYADMIRETAGGGYVLTADTKSRGAGGYDINVLKLDSGGNPVWDYTYGDSLQNGCQGILITSEGNYLVYGETEIFQFSLFNFYMELIDPSGASLWRYTPGGAGADAAFSAAEAADGSFIFTGYSNSNTGGTKPNDLVVFRADRSGAILWSRYFGGAGIDIGYDIIRARDNSLLIAGKWSETDEQFYLLNLSDTTKATGIFHPSEASLVSLVYPNPSGGRCVIEARREMESPWLEVYSSSGERVLSRQLIGRHRRLELHLPVPGLYCYRIQERSGLTGSGKILVTGLPE
jgi:hypothetical protein